MNSEQTTGLEQIFQIVASFKGFILFPAKSTQQTLHGKSGTVHGQGIAATAVMDSTRLLHSFGAGPVILFISEIHDTIEPSCPKVHKCSLTVGVKDWIAKL